MDKLARVLAYLYAWLVRLYPRGFRTRFEDEMRTVFAAALDQVGKQGILALADLGLRELLGAPAALLGVHWSGWIAGLRSMRSPSNAIPPLPPPPPDGRTSWAQASLEASMFLAMGLVLVLQTYLPRLLPAAGSSLGLRSIGVAVLLLSIPTFLAGLAHGLPRWAYPFGGMVLGYSLLAAIRFRKLPLLAASALAFAALTAAAVVVHLWVRPLPAWLRRLGQSIEVDWTRLSFCVYGAMPPTIVAAFDNAYLDNRTPYLAVSVLLMVAGALVYARSQRTAAQMTVLLGSTSLCFVCALLDHLHFAGGMGSWVAEGGWMLRLWSSVAGLMVAPILIGMARRALTPRQTA